MESITIFIGTYKEEMALNKRLGRLLKPNMGAYFIILFGFMVAAALSQQYLLAAIELLALAAIYHGA